MSSHTQSSTPNSAATEFVPGVAHSPAPGLAPAVIPDTAVTSDAAATSDMRPSPKPATPLLWVRVSCAATTVLVLLGVWELAVDVWHVSDRVLAAPSAFFTSLMTSWDVLGPAAAITAYEGVAGFAVSVVVGLALGIALYLSRLFHAAVYPLLVMAQTLPLITMAPLFVIWFGFEPLGKIVMVALFSTFPIAVQTYRGLGAVPTFYSDVALTCGASPTWTLFHVKLRVAAHHIVGGMKIAAAYVFATAATAEYLGARGGLGIVLQSAFNSFRTPLIFASTVVIIAMTGIVLGILTACEKMLLGTSARDFATGGNF